MRAHFDYAHALAIRTVTNSYELGVPRDNIGAR